MSDEYDDTDDAAYTEADLVTAATLARLEAERAGVRTLLAFAAAEGLSAASVLKALSGTAAGDAKAEPGDDYIGTRCPKCNSAHISYPRSHPECATCSKCHHEWERAVEVIKAAPNDPPVDDDADADDDVDTDLWTPAVAKAFDLHHDATDAERLAAAVKVALAALEDGSDPEESLGRLHEHGTFEKGHWDAALHPKGKDGRFIKKDDIQAAKSDPKKAKELKKKVTDPEERKKLDKLLADPTPIGTKRGLAKHENETKRAQKTADRAKAREIRIRLIDQDSRGEELNPDDLRALIPHLGQMSHEELSHTRELLARQGASFGGKRLRADRVAALVAWATGKAQPQPAEAESGTAAAEPAPTGTSAAPHAAADAEHRAASLDANALHRRGFLNGPRPVGDALRALATSAELDASDMGPASDKLKRLQDAGYVETKDGRVSMRTNFGPARPEVLDRVRAEFDRLNARNDNNFVSLADIRDAMPDVPLRDLHAAVQHLRRAGEVVGNSLESGHAFRGGDAGDARARSIGIAEEREFIVNLSRRGGASAGPLSKTPPAQQSTGTSAAPPNDSVDEAHDLWRSTAGARGESLEQASARLGEIERMPKEVVAGLVERLGFSKERSHKANVEKLRRSLANLRVNQNRADSITGTSATPDPTAPPKTRLQALAEKSHAQGTPNDDVNTEYAKPRDQYAAFVRAVVPKEGTKPDSATVLDYLGKLPDHARERLDQHFRAAGKSLREVEQFHRQAAGQVSPEQVRADRAARADAGDAARAAMTGSGATPKVEHPRDRLGRLRSMIPHAGTGGGFSPQKGDAVATIGDEVAAGKYSVVGASRDGTKFTIRPDRDALTADQRKLLRSDPAKYDKTVSAFEVIPPSHGSIARRLAGVVGDADTNQAGANLVLDAAERDLAVTPSQAAPVPQPAPKPAPVPREVKNNFTPEQIATQAEAFKRHTTDAQAGLPGRRDVALAVMNQFRNTATAQELKDFARAVGVSGDGTRDQIGQRLVAYALDDPKRAAPTPTGTNADPKHVAQMDKAEAAAEDQIRRVGETEAGAKRVRAERMVPAWVHHTNKGNAASAAEAERRILSHGAERLHAAGEVVPFDGRTMEAQTGVSDGAPVRVTRHGWHMPGDPGMPLAQAQVEPVASGTGAAPAATNLDAGSGAANNAPAQQGGASVNRTSAGAGGAEPPKVPHEQAVQDFRTALVAEAEKRAHQYFTVDGGGRFNDAGRGRTSRQREKRPYKTPASFEHYAQFSGLKERFNDAQRAGELTPEKLEEFKAKFERFRRGDYSEPARPATPEEVARNQRVEQQRAAAEAAATQARKERKQGTERNNQRVAQQGFDTRKIHNDLFGGDGVHTLADGRKVSWEVVDDRGQPIGESTPADANWNYRYSVSHPDGTVTTSGGYPSRSRMQDSGELRKLLTAKTGTTA